MKDKIGKPKELTDAEAEAFIRYLTKIEKPKKKTVIDILLETPTGKQLVRGWLKNEKK